MLDLKIDSARYVLGLLPSLALPKIATEALISDFDSAATRVLAGLDRPPMWEAGPLFEKMLTDLQVPLPSPEEAALRLVRHYIQEVAQRRTAPEEGLKQLIEVHSLARKPDQSRRFVGEEYGIEQLVGARWAYEDLAERPSEVSFQGLYDREAVRAFDEHVVQLAQIWLDEHDA